MVVVAFKRWSLTRVYYPLTRGSNFRTLTGKIVLFWMGNCIWGVVTKEISTIFLNDLSVPNKWCTMVLSKKCYTNKLRILTSAGLLFHLNMVISSRNVDCDIFTVC